MHCCTAFSWGDAAKLNRVHIPVNVKNLAILRLGVVQDILELLVHAGHHLGVVVAQEPGVGLVHLRLVGELARHLWEGRVAYRRGGRGGKRRRRRQAVRQGGERGKGERGVNFEDHVLVVVVVGVGVGVCGQKTNTMVSFVCVFERGRKRKKGSSNFAGLEGQIYASRGRYAGPWLIVCAAREWPLPRGRGHYRATMSSRGLQVRAVSPKSPAVEEDPRAELERPEEPRR